MATGSPSEPSVLLRGLGLILAIFLLVGSASILAKIGGIQYVPSPFWVEKGNLIGLSVGLIAATLVIVLMMLTGKRRTEEYLSDLSWLKSVAVTLFGVFMVFAIGRESIISGFPMLYTIFLGEKVAHQFVVAKADSYSDRKCPNKIELRDMPIMSGDLCGLPNTFRDTLKTGSRIVVSGRGTALGVYVENVRLIDDGPDP